MKLSEACLRPGDVILCRGFRTYQSGIQHWTDSAFNHGMGVASGSPNPVIIEALEGEGVRRRFLAAYLHEVPEDYSFHWFRLRQGHVDEAKLATFWQSQVGKAYASWWQFVWSFGWLSSRIREWLGWPADTDPERWFCFELVAAAYFRAGYVPPKGCRREAALITGQDFQLWPILDYRGELTP